jgi:hypothetical protein
MQSQLHEPIVELSQGIALSRLACEALKLASEAILVLIETGERDDKVTRAIGSEETGSEPAGRLASADLGR